MKIHKIIILIIFTSLLINSCKAPDKIILPPGNLNQVQPDNQVNTDKDEVSPMQLPQNDREECSACSREMNVQNQGQMNEDVVIKPGSFYTMEMLFPVKETTNREAYNYMANNVESVFFTSSKSGFVSLAYEPSKGYAEDKMLPFKIEPFSENGGVDIYEFYFNLLDNKYYFKNLGGTINSKFWDSNPIVISDTVGTDCYTLLIWSSDRNSPYRQIINLKGEVIPNVNKDLFYSFRINNGDWSEPKTIEGGNLNTKANEITPFLYCSCANPTLLFSSNRLTPTTESYDLYYAKLHIDYKNKEVVVTSDAKLIDSVQNANLNNYVVNGINTTFDERFPYIPNILHQKAGENYIYFSSNRYDKAMNSKIKEYQHRLGVKKDTLIQNNGGYDIYRMKLPDKPELDCVPPPPPVYNIYLVVKINEIKKGKNGEIISEQKNIPNSSYLIKGKKITNPSEVVNFNDIPDSQSWLSQNVYELEKSHRYKIYKELNLNNCETGECSEVEVITPPDLSKNDTLYVEVTCVRTAQPEKIAQNESYSKGIAFFVTGYWWPTTSENLKELKKRLDNGCLDKSKFIDITDYKPDSRDFYVAAAENNDKYFNDELFPKITSMLSKIDPCSNNQKILITIHAFTDPCPLRTIRDEAGTITQEYTTYSCDEQVVFNDIIINPSAKMKEPNTLPTTDNSSFKSKFGSQQGNVVLAMLRSYYTMKTIKNGLKKYMDDKGLKYDIDELIKFDLDAFGIYDEIGKKCPNKDNIYGLELINKKYPEDDFEPCNIPHSRRAMIYVDLISNKPEEEKLYIRNECGELIHPQPLVAKKEKETKKKVEEVEAPKTEKPKTVYDIFTREEELKKKEAEQLPCAGPPCYWWIHYGVASSKEEYEIMLKVLYNLGITDVSRDKNIKDQWVLISSPTTNKDVLEIRLAEYREKFENKLKGLFEDWKLNAKIVPINQK